MKKFKLNRTIATFAVVTALSVGISSFASNQNTTPIPFTQDDITANVTFSRELQQIMEQEEITFQNEELKAIIEEEIGGPITKESLSNVNILTITKRLNNNDLSELKYLPHLNSILIYDNKVDIKDLQYNQDLYSIIINSCEITNLSSLPNSTELITLKNSKCFDNEVTLPYYTKELESIGTIINNIRFKNPAYLEKLDIYTDVVLDMNNLKDCTNLKEISLQRVSNIRNAHILKTLPNLETITLDEYASIWLDLDTLNSLPISQPTKEYLTNQITTLDNLATTIIPPNQELTPEQKTKEIVLYLLDKFEYDHSSVENYEIDSSGVVVYNDNPISTIIEQKQGVCINYACLFTALANRVGIENFQLYNDVHTWNSVKSENGYRGYDLSYLEYGAIVEVQDISTLVMIKDITAQDLIRENKEDKLCFYEFDIEKIIDDNHIADYTPQQLKETLLNIGYINDNSLTRIIEKDQEKLYKMDVFTKSYLILLLLSLILFKLKDKISDKKEIEDYYDYIEYDIEEPKVLKK